MEPAGANSTPLMHMSVKFIFVYSAITRRWELRWRLKINIHVIVWSYLYLAGMPNGDLNEIYVS